MLNPTTIKKIIQGLSRGLCYCGMFALIPMMLLTAGDVLGRSLWHRPIPGTVELSSYLLAVFVLLGAGYTQQVKGHVRVTFLQQRLPERIALLLEMLATLLSLFVVAILGWQGLMVGLEAQSVSDMLRIPQWPFRLLVAMAAALLILELGIDLAAAARKLARS